MSQLAIQSLDDFYQLLESNLSTNSLQKLLLSKYRGEDKSIKRLTIRPVIVQKKPALSFLYQHQTKDITKNYFYDEALEKIKRYFGADFKDVYLTANDVEVQLSYTKKNKLQISHHQPSNQQKKLQQHDREKNRFVDINRPFLTVLGVTDHDNKLIPSMAKKWKQINKFIEVFSHALNSSDKKHSDSIKVVDFGSGKGYLTFALHDYLINTLKLSNTQVTGVELRQPLTDLCNKAVVDLSYQGLTFVCGDVRSRPPEKTNVMIALHACDVATDYAIHFGIRSDASIIMCSPCCHKQIRPQMESPDIIKPMLKYGIHMGQQAEMLTDAMRALFLEANGYTTKVFEFISLEHTNKNKMILAVKNPTYNEKNRSKALSDIEEIKSFYGIKDHCLETLLEGS